MIKKIALLSIVFGLISSHSVFSYDSSTQTIKDLPQKTDSALDSKLGDSQIQEIPYEKPQTATAPLIPEISTKVLSDILIDLGNYVGGTVLGEDVWFGGRPLPMQIEVTGALTGLQKPAMAYDPVNARYLIVWEQANTMGVGSQIYGRFIEPSGRTQGSAILISNERTREGCFYQGFASLLATTRDPMVSAFDWSGITVPNNCPRAKNPSIAYNDGKFLVAWQLEGEIPPPAATHSQGGDLRFSSIVAKLIDASSSTLAPASVPSADNWSEGVLISGAPQAATRRCLPGQAGCMATTANRTLTNNDVYGWTQHDKPSVAADTSGNGFMVAWQSNVNFLFCNSASAGAGPSATPAPSTLILARSINPNFNRLGAPTNSLRFTVFDDSATNAQGMPSRCDAALVKRAANPKIAYNEAANNFLVVFESSTAALRRSKDIAAKRIIRNSSSDWVLDGSINSAVAVTNPMSPVSFANPDVASLSSNYYISFDTSSSLTMPYDVFVRRLGATDQVLGDQIPLPRSTAETLSRQKASISVNVSPGGRRVSPERVMVGAETIAQNPARLVVAFQEGTTAKAAILDAATLMPSRSVLQLSGMEGAATALVAGGNYDGNSLNNFLVAWVSELGMGAGNGKVLATPVSTVESIEAPVLENPAQAARIEMTSTTLTWSHPGGENIVYDVYFAPVGAMLNLHPTCRNLSTNSCNLSGLSFGMNYQWTVEAKDQTNPSRRARASEIRMFSVSTLDAPVLTSPDNGVTLNTNSAMLSWTHPGGAGIVFDVYLSSSMGMFMPVTGCQAITMNACSVSSLSYGNTYQWFVEARDTRTMGRSARSIETRSFRVIDSLGAPVLVSPANGARLTADRVTLSWMPISGRTGLTYNVIVEVLESGMTRPFRSQMGIAATTTSYELTGLSSVTTYQWRVEAQDATMMRIPSETRNFSVGDLNPPSAPALAAQPANGATWAPTRLYLSWTAAPAAENIAKYEVYFNEGSVVPAAACPYKSLAVTAMSTPTNFIIQASTDGRAQYRPDTIRPMDLPACTLATETYLTAPEATMMTRAYAWKICAVNTRGSRTCSEERRFNTDDSVVGWWRFDRNPTTGDCPAGLGARMAPAGDTGESVCDYSGKGNHGIPRGNPMFLASGMGILGGALQFDGMDDWVEVADSASLRPSAWSVEVSFTTLGEGVNWPRMIHKRNYNISGMTDRGWALTRLHDGTRRFNFGVLNGPEGIGLSTMSGVNLSQRYRAIASYASNALSFYLDSVLQSSMMIPWVFTHSNASLQIGAESSERSFFNGSVEEATYYGRVLTNEEITNANLAR